MWVKITDSQRSMYNLHCSALLQLRKKYLKCYKTFWLPRINYIQSNFYILNIKCSHCKISLNKTRLINRIVVIKTSLDQCCAERN